MWSEGSTREHDSPEEQCLDTQALNPGSFIHLFNNYLSSPPVSEMVHM